MSKKPTYEELEQRIKEFEREIAEQNNSDSKSPISLSELRFLVENSPDHCGFFLIHQSVESNCLFQLHRCGHGRLSKAVANQLSMKPIAFKTIMREK